MFWAGGVAVSDLALPKNRINFQLQLLQTQIALENAFVQMAKATREPSVVLCDRGAMDGSAYMDPDEFKQVLEALKLDRVELRDSRYDSVFHLVTAANGAIQYYGDATNSTRYETVEGACDVDLKLQAAWVGHPRVYIFDNSTDFEGKMQRIVKCMIRLVGLPSTQKAFKRYLIAAPPAELPVKCEIFDVTKVYILVKEADHKSSNEAFSFIRKRAKGKFASYGLTDVRVTESGEKLESKRILTAREYESYHKFADETRHIVTVRRTCFLYENTYFEVNEYLTPCPGLAFVNVQQIEGLDTVDGVSDSIKFPPFLNILEDITGSNKYSAYALSLKREATTIDV
jgi:hypothetical protein